jgi:hypothetical protein
MDTSCHGGQHVRRILRRFHAPRKGKLLFSAGPVARIMFSAGANAPDLLPANGQSAA